MKFPKKSLGQNFLIDKNIIKKIVNLVDVYNRHVIEIGPGKGSLTDEILKRKPRSISIIEKDSNLYKDLKSKYSTNKEMKIFNNDILKFNIEKIISKNTIIFGNLPYNISSQILVKIIKLKSWPPKFQDIIFMFQKELGEKIISNYPSSKYNRLSILSNYRLFVSKKFEVSNNCFFPRPKIKSLVIHFKPKLKSQIKILDLGNLEKVTNSIFSNKRKMIKKNIQKILDNNDIKKVVNLNLNLRPSEIEPEIYYKITQLYENK